MDDAKKSEQEKERWGREGGGGGGGGEETPVSPSSILPLFSSALFAPLSTV